MSTFTRENYEALIYSLARRYPEITLSTLELYTKSRTTAIIKGSIYFQSGLELRVFEYIDLSDGEILDYGYTLFQGEKKIRWYDPQPHPENSALKATFPHHYHEEPNIKKNRKLAYGISFEAPNLLTVIDDCLKLG